MLSRLNICTDFDVLLYADDLAVLGNSRVEFHHKLNVYIAKIGTCILMSIRVK